MLMGVNPGVNCFLFCEGIFKKRDKKRKHIDIFLLFFFKNLCTI